MSLSRSSSESSGTTDTDNDPLTEEKKKHLGMELEEFEYQLAYNRQFGVLQDDEAFLEQKIKELWDFVAEHKEEFREIIQESQEEDGGGGKKRDREEDTNLNNQLLLTDGASTENSTNDNDEDIQQTKTAKWW